MLDKTDREFIAGKILKIAVLFKDELSGLHEEIAGLHEEISGLHEEMSGFREELSGFKKELLALKEELSGFKGELSEFRKEMRELEARLNLKIEMEIEHLARVTQEEFANIRREFA